MNDTLPILPATYAKAFSDAEIDAEEEAIRELAERGIIGWAEANAQIDALLDGYNQ